MSGHRTPNLFIVGAPKSGTTAMTEYLGQHPEVHMCHRKEMHFFGSDLTRRPHEFFVLDEARYRSMFRYAKDETWVGEASVMYLMSRNAAAEIKAFSPEARIIIMLRNPVETLHAYHSQLLWGCYEELEDFEAALDAEPDRRDGRRLPSGTMMTESVFYTEVIRYSEQVERYLEIFGDEAVHLILFDDFRADVHRAYADTLAFLGAAPHEPESFKVVNPNKRLRSRRLMGLIQQPPAPVSVALGCLDDRLRYWLMGKLSRLITRLEPRTPLPEHVRARLREHIAPEVERLSRLLGRNLDHWVQAPER